MDAINGAVHCISRLSIGNTVLELLEVVRATIIVPAKQVDDAVRHQMRQVVQHLRDNDYMVLKEHLEPDESRLEVLEGEIGAIDRWLQLAGPLNHPVLADNVRHLTKASQKLHDLHAKEKQRIDARTLELRQEEAEMNPFSDSDDEDDDEDGIDGGEQESYGSAPVVPHQRQTASNSASASQPAAVDTLLAEVAKHRHLARELRVQLTHQERVILAAHRRNSELEERVFAATRRVNTAGTGSYVPPGTAAQAAAETTANADFVTAVKQLFDSGLLEGLHVETPTTNDLLESLVQLGRDHSAVRVALVTQG